VGDEVLEAQAIEELEEVPGEPGLEEVRRLPEPVNPGELEVWRGEVRTAAIAAAGGIVAGAATVAAVRAARSAASRARPSRLLRRQERPGKILASRSFLVDVHLLGR